MLIKKYNYETTKITAIAVDSYNGDYLWIGYAINSNNICKLRKVSAHDFSQIYYEIDLSVSKIVDISFSGGSIYVAVDDDTLMVRIYDVSSPLTISSDVNLPSGINEKPIAIIMNGPEFYVLFPGIIAGENAKLCYYNYLGNIEIIDLNTITNASSLTMGSEGNIWIVTNESPSKLVRVYLISGGIYVYSTTILS